MISRRKNIREIDLSEEGSTSLLPVRSPGKEEGGMVASVKLLSRPQHKLCSCVDDE